MANQNPKIDHLIVTRFKPGENANPNNIGKDKKRRSFKSILEDILPREIEVEDPFTKVKVKKGLDECINLAVIGKAFKGDLGAYQEIRDMVDGRVPNVKPEETDTAKEALSAQVYDLVRNNKQQVENTVDGVSDATIVSDDDSEVQVIK